jgi:methylenetetrahydrofolate dehydrogenase (NADP+)/methenyltetrahydrofolate cyclohydrolase
MLFHTRDWRPQCALAHRAKMTARILDGNALAQKLRADFKTRAEALAARGARPCLAVILVGEDPASQVYVRNKVAACEKAGMRSLSDVYAPDVDPAVVFARIAELNADPTVHGILVQLPLPKHFDSGSRARSHFPGEGRRWLPRRERRCADAGQPALHPLHALRRHENAGERERAAEGRRSRHRRPQQHRRQADGHAAAGAKLHGHHLPFAVEGPGLPHPRADILVAAVGRAKMITGDMIKPGATVIDVGINRTARRQALRRRRFRTAKEVAGAITPVPGGVGPMTITMLLANTLEAAEREVR